MTSSRELVRQTLEFASPARVPRQLWLLPWAAERYPAETRRLQARFPDDIVGPPTVYRQPLRQMGEMYAIGTYVDEWGCTFKNIQAGVIGEVKDALVKDWADLQRVRAPEECLTVDVEQVNTFCRSSDKFVIGTCCPRPFERLQFLRGSEQLYLDLAEPSGDLLTLLDRVHQFYVKELKVWAGTEVDGLMFMDDWGAQHNLLISPRQWRRLFKPLYKEYIDIAHAHGKKAFMHSDGYTAAILPDLVELGLDALNAQIFVMDIEALGRQFGGRLTFWGELDRQWLLPNGTPDEVAAAVRRVKNAFWRQGGAIAQCEFGPGGKPENVWQMFATWESLA